MPKSDCIGKLTEALSKAQVAFLPIKRTEKVDFPTTSGRKKYNYAPLEAVIEATRKALSDNGLAVMQTLKLVEGDTVLETLLGHLSGEWISGESYVGKQDVPPQSEGSSLTYKRRYGMSAILCLASEEDDDAEGAGKEEDKKTVSSEKQVGKTEHFCEIHKTPFFKRGQMKAFAHPIAGTEPVEWCPEHKEKVKSALAQAEEDIDEFYPRKQQSAKPVEAPPVSAVAPPVASEVSEVVLGVATRDNAIPGSVIVPPLPTDRETWVREALPRAQWAIKDVADWIIGRLKVSIPKGTKLGHVINELSAKDWTALETEINSRIEAAGK